MTTNTRYTPEDPSHDEPMWTIEVGVPGTDRDRPAPPWSVGEVLRAEVSTVAVPVPEDTPGRRDTAGGTVSLIVEVVEVLRPVFCRGEDSGQPSVLRGEDGWRCWARVRAADPAAAADLLAAAGREHFADLAREGFTEGQIVADKPEESETAAADTEPEASATHDEQ